MNKFILFVVCLIGGVSVTGFAEILVALSISPVNTIATQSGIALVPFAIGWLIAKLFSFFIKKIPFFTVWVFCSVAIIAIMFLGSSFKDKEPSYYPSDQPSSTTNIDSKNYNCIFVWSVSQRKFLQTDANIYDSISYKNIIITKIGKEDYAENLLTQLRKADAQKNEILAKSIAKEVIANSLTIFFEKNLSAEFISLIAEEQNLRSRCL